MFITPFKDACGVESVPRKGSAGTYDSEPNLPEGMPTRDGGLLPEKTRDSHITTKSPEWVSPTRQSFKFGNND